MRRIAIITARGGSKRIPKKNIKEFCGKPIIAYSIEAAIESKVFDEVMVSTDSEEIAEVAREYGASVPFMRSEKNADDYATTNDVLLEVLAEYEKRGQIFDIITYIYPTAPFITSEKLQQAIALLDDSVDMVMPVVQYSFPPQRAFVIENDMLRYQYPQYTNSRSQDLSPIFHDCGQFGVLWNKSIDKDMAHRNIAPQIVSELEVQDIDNETDWKLAELKYQLMYNINK